MKLKMGVWTSQFIFNLSMPNTKDIRFTISEPIIATVADGIHHGYSVPVIA